MKKIFELKRNGKTMCMELELNYYLSNYTLSVELIETGSNDGYWRLTRCMNVAAGRNRVFLDANNMGAQIVEELENAGFGKKTGRKVISGFVTYPEFEFDEEVLKACSNLRYEEYLKFQDALKDGEEYLNAECRICQKNFHFIVKSAAVQKYQEYLCGAPYLIQDIFPEMSPEKRGLLAYGQNMCGECFRRMFGIIQ